ncbi:MAG: Gfo/Idh/MocA family oxidoreductase, partial [Betaproteobacteria bacterium]
MPVMNVAIVGCGWVADWHVADGFAPLPECFSVVACCDTNEERLAAFAQRHDIPRRCLTLQDVLAMPDVDVVVVCTPPSVHHEMVMATLAAGKH